MRVWTDEQKQRQRDAIGRWQPWAKSTGPRTADGKRASSRNSYKHGRSSAESLAHRKTLNAILRNARAVIAWGRAYRAMQRRLIPIILKKAQNLQNELLTAWRKHSAVSPLPPLQTTPLWPPPQFKMAA